MCALPVWPNVAPHSRTDYGWSPDPPMTRALLIGLAWLATLEGPGAHQAPDPLAARSKGRRSAAVTVYEMSDFQCPYCRGFALEAMPALEREYVATGKVRLVYIMLALPSSHPNAFPAAAVHLGPARPDPCGPPHD